MNLTAGLLCMALAIYHEARGEPLNGQFAVAQVIENRVNSKRFPNDTCSVVFQGGERRHKCHFSFYCDGKSDQPLDVDAWETAKAVARTLKNVSGIVRFEVGGADHYHTLDSRPWWAAGKVPTAKVGNHLFYELSQPRISLSEE